MIRSWCLVGVALGAVGLTAATAWGQAVGPPLGAPIGTPSGQPFGQFLGLTEVPPAFRGPLTVTPTFAVGEEYNDNIFLDNRNKRSDFITGFTPGVTLLMRDPVYGLGATYNFTAAIYAREEQLSDAFERQSFFANGFYRVTRRFTLNVTDTFIMDRNTNRVSPTEISTGRNRSWSHTFTPGASWQITPRTTLGFFGSYLIQRFEGAGSTDSDVYRIQGDVDRLLTPRLTATAGYQFAYFNFERGESVTTHTPRIGLRYRLTPTLTVAASGGPTFEVRGDDARVGPAASATIVQRFRWGSASVFYDRAVATTGGSPATPRTAS